MNQPPAYPPENHWTQLTLDRPDRIQVEALCSAIPASGGMVVTLRALEGAGRNLVAMMTKGYDCTPTGFAMLARDYAVWLQTAVERCEPF